jgi:phosphopantothenoylcysteine synthetase/decarboxylase
MNTFEGRKILVTAGPTWVSIDSVRVITNIFKGTLGLIIAEEAAKRGAKVTLLLGPASISPSQEYSKFRIIRFKFFDDLYELMRKEITSRKYDVVVHSAAVSDYVPTKIFDGKIKSGKRDLVIRLIPTAKIVDQIKKWDPKVFLVKFKVEGNVSKEDLIQIAYNSMRSSNANLIVANDIKDIGEKTHKALIIDLDKRIVATASKEGTAKCLLDMITQQAWKLARN